MHPTADTRDVILSNGLGRRVIGGVRRLVADVKMKGMRAESRTSNQLHLTSGRGSIP
jgi:hypothetical protein